MGFVFTRRGPGLAHMLLNLVLTELLLAKDYTQQSAQRRSEVLSEFIQWANELGVTNVEDATRAFFRRYMSYLRERPNPRYGGHLSGETQHRRSSIVRMYLRFAVREGWLDEKVVAFFDMPKRPQKIIQVFGPDHYSRLMRATDLCTLTLDAVCISPNESYLRVEGKGRKQRELGMDKQTTLALHRYQSRGRPESALPWVFLTKDSKPMTTNGIDRMLYRLRDTAGTKHFEGIRVSAHTRRHSFAVHYRQQGGDIYKLSRVCWGMRTSTPLNASSERSRHATRDEAARVCWTT